jgi:hypothetical protein
LRKRYVHDNKELHNVTLAVKEEKEGEEAEEDLQPSSKDMIWVLGAYCLHLFLH